MATPLLSAMALMIKTFDQYAGSDDDNKTLSKKEARALVEKELSYLQGDEQKPKAEELDEVIACWDEDGDSKIDFREFVKMLIDCGAFIEVFQMLSEDVIFDES